MASGLAWKRLSPCWRELGLASSRMLKLAFSLDKGWGLEAAAMQGEHGQPQKLPTLRQHHWSTRLRVLPFVE